MIIKRIDPIEKNESVNILKEPHSQGLGGCIPGTRGGGGRGEMGEGEETGGHVCPILSSHRTLDAYG